MVIAKYNINEIADLIAKDLQEKGIDAKSVVITQIQVGSRTFANQTSPKSIKLGVGARLDITVEW